MSQLRIGSLFSGGGLLDLAIVEGGQYDEDRTITAVPVSDVLAAIRGGQ